MASILKKEYSERKRYLLELLLEPCDAEKSLRNSLDDQQMSLFLDTLDHRDRLDNHFAWHCYKAAFRKGARTMMEL